MKRGKPSRQNSIPNDAVLLIPEPDGGEEPTCGVKPGYYDAKQMLNLVEKHMNDADAVQFIADMLETGDPDNDGFAVMLRQNQHDAPALARIIHICRT